MPGHVYYWYSSLILSELMILIAKDIEYIPEACSPNWQACYKRGNLLLLIEGWFGVIPGHDYTPGYCKSDYMAGGVPFEPVKGIY